MALCSEPVNLEVNLLQPVSIESSAGGYNLFTERCHSYAWCDNVFEKNELDTLLNICKSLSFEKGQIASNNQSDEVRNSNVKFLYPNRMTSWIFEKLAGSIHHMNEEYFGFDLNQIQEGIQLTRYEAPQQHYVWHLDRSLSLPTRKLSVVVQLSDPEDYSGGELELMLSDDIETFKKDQGSAIFFPSWTLHRVKPVTQGVRYSLVCWVSGPPFK